tara:strand:+ start:159 stop:956 length:798 start_codon:yes stop_codon:yes gene_type:complete
MMNSPLKWVGGKNKCCGYLLHKFPKQFDRYFEPFFGSGVMFLNLRPDISVLSDANKNLISFYLHVQDSVEDLWGQLQLLSNSSENYYSIRQKFNQSENYTFETAAQFLYLNRCGFNGLYRVNKSGKYNVPWGKRNGEPHLVYESLFNMHNALQGVTIRHADYSESLAGVKAGDFVYMDPPYLMESDIAFTGYTKEGFGLKQHEELAAACHKLDTLGAKFAVSNSKLVEVEKLWAGFKTHWVLTTRSVSASGSGRGQHMDLLITNY